ncbi:hypothetical protein ABZX88_03360 [Kitasatospora aureofaciens]|uniref:hypothetical protein n=1 Tax=Kitasatospora aureofaciens TaxID=1894 RepID=UPI000525749D|nr:hypothetical protein [Kitasatospora aureofaciens]HJD80947.1 hypothetical protein [Kitasatospora aureofaciens]
MRRTVAGLAALLAAVPLLTACSSGGPSAWTPSPGAPTDPSATESAAPATRPDTEVAIPSLNEAGHATSPYPTSTVTLTAGQRLGVQLVDSMTGWAWNLTATGDGAVVRRGPDVVTDPCPADSIGCSPGIDQTFSALAPGTTTLTWTFVDRGRCSGTSPDPARGCGRVTKSVQVTVR